MFQTTPLSIEFCARLILRVEREYQARRDSLVELLTPVTTSVETAAQVIERNARSRDEAYEELRTLENLLLLKQGLSTLVSRAAFEAGIPEKEQRISTLRTMSLVLSLHMVGLPSRARAEDDMMRMAEQFSGLRATGTGETAAAERGRLRAVTRDMPVFGREDGAEYESRMHSMQSTIDLLEAELKALQVGTSLTVTLPADLAKTLSMFWVELSPVQEQELEPEGTQGSAEVASPSQS